MVTAYLFFFFFFSSRRRHTRCSRDWSSDVCSSDLGRPIAPSRGLRLSLNPPSRVALTSLEPVAPCNGVGMRIALVTEFYYPHLGGVTEHVHNLALEFRHRGHEVTVVTANMDGQGRDPEFVRRVGTSRIVYSNGSFPRVTTGGGLARPGRDLLPERRGSVG